GLAAVTRRGRDLDRRALQPCVSPRAHRQTRGSRRGMGGDHRLVPRARLRGRRRVAATRARAAPPMPLEIDLSGRVALVTGGSGGLGRADALTLARAGADVAIADIKLESDSGEDAERYGVLAQAARAQGMVYTEATADEIRALGRRSLALKCDV